MDIFEKMLSKGDFIRQASSHQSFGDNLDLQWQRFIKLFLFYLAKRIAYSLPKSEQNTILNGLDPKNTSDINTFMKRALNYVKNHPTTVNIMEIATISRQDTYTNFFQMQTQ